MLYHWTFHHEGRHLGHQSTIPLPQRNHSDIVPRHLSEIQTYNVIYFSVCRRGKYICRPSKFQVTYRVGNDKGNISRNIWARCEFGSYQTPLQQQPDILPNISLPTSLNHRYWVWKRGAEAAKKGKNAKKCWKEIFRLEFFLETYFVWTWEFLGTSVDTILEKWIIFHVFTFLNPLRQELFTIWTIKEGQFRFANFAAHFKRKCHFQHLIAEKVIFFVFNVWVILFPKILNLITLLTPIILKVINLQCSVGWLHKDFRSELLAC